MAKPQLQRLNAVTVWMILFVGLWLTSTVFLVILYTGQAELQEEVDRSREAYAKVISSAEKGSIELAKRGQARGPTVVGLIEGARAQTAELATGNPDDDPPSVRAKLEQLLQTIQAGGVVPRPERFSGTSYHEALSVLYKEFEGQVGLWRDTERRLAELDQEIQRLAQDQSQQKDLLDKRSKEMTDQFKEIEADRTKFREDGEARIAQIKKEFDGRRQRSEADLTNERRQSGELRQELVVRASRIDNLQKMVSNYLPGPGDLINARKEDGLILKAVPGDDVVYINLGRNDRLVLDLEFAVYSAESGIPRDGRSKARIRIVSIYTSSSECEVVRLRPGEIIGEGDLIANPVYDSDRTVSFVVLGKFDLDRNGVIDTDGAATIKALITHWGGQALTELTGLTDFVVAGAPPRAPRKNADQTSEQASRARQRQAARDRFEETLKRAQLLSVPVLSERVFLSYLGYTGRLTGR